ncbi:RagB/SusD family nutrient uptake outer membrane protein [Sphingobacterium sp. Mn56C]|uniref:RagB/SusD family nutrient uptake outer membrane protein n=1 Tax=Sphingobacterium sp. Mn56C TaxID=3395261 RepID=UPI003BD07392
MKLKSILYTATAALLFCSCTDLSETLYDKVSAIDYGNTTSEIETILGKAYASLRGGSADGVHFYPTGEFVFFVNAVSSDECVIPTRVGGDWGDGGVYLELQKHTWTPDNPKLWAPWKYGYNGVASTNAILHQLENANLDAKIRKPMEAEVKALRAYYYYKLMDWYGNIPLDTTYSAKEVPATSPRAELYKFIEKELKNSIPYLPQNQYGRFTRNAAHLLLARLYLNSEIYIGQQRWQDCLEECSKIAGQLSPDYFASFKSDNEKSPEIIFSIPYDSKAGTVGNYLASMTYHYEQKWVFDKQDNYPWCGNGIVAQPQLYALFEENDIRRKSLRVGPQIDARTGATLVMPRDGNPLIYTPEINSITTAQQNEGARLNKYEDKAGDVWERDYDLVLMRYAEVLMMQAECHVRLNNPAAAKPFIEQIRNRIGLPMPATIDLQFIEDELGREFVFEDHRRTDNIRFGSFFKAWWEKGAGPADKHTAIFPIPRQEMIKNSRLTQNPGY